MLGIYIHVPFCQRRCGYCAFATVSVGDELDEETARRFTDLVIVEMQLVAIPARGIPPRPAQTLYLGGGTPTMLPVEQVERLIEAARRHLGLVDEAEVTIEANPDALVGGQLDALHRMGVTRVSFGMQSTSPRVLDLLDRTHDPVHAIHAVADAHRAGFDHVSLDLIYGTPGESVEELARSLATAIDSGVDHVSAYALGVEPGTKLAARVRSGELPQPLGDDAAQRYTVAEEMLREAGFDWYELSNWARSNPARSKHNMLYWRGGDWIGLGPSSHSHLGGVRWHSPAALSRWSDALSAGRTERVEVEVLSDSERELERVMTGIRLADGLSTDGLDPDRVTAVVNQGLATVADDAVVLTLRGRLLADTVVMALTA